jgi:hypothetical protein
MKRVKVSIDKSTDIYKTNKEGLAVIPITKDPSKKLIHAKKRKESESEKM